MIGGEAGWTGLVNSINGTGLEQGYFPNLTFENPVVGLPHLQFR